MKSEKDNPHISEVACIAVDMIIQALSEKYDRKIESRVKALFTETLSGEYTNDEFLKCYITYVLMHGGLMEFHLDTFSNSAKFENLLIGITNKYSEIS